MKKVLYNNLRKFPLFRVRIYVWITLNWILYFVGDLQMMLQQEKNNDDVLVPFKRANVKICFCVLKANQIMSERN